MKKRLTRKLFLSLAALGVTAATLTTSTFAWYTANTEAKVTQISAGTESKGSDSLFIAAAQTYDAQANGYAAKTWGGYLAEATPVLTNHTEADATKKKLRPVYSNYSTNAFNQAASTKDENPATAVKGRSYNRIASASGSAVKYEDESTNDFIEFVIRVRSGNKITATEGQPLYFSSFSLTSTQESSSQIALASGTGTGITAAGEYSADLIKALKLDVTSEDVTLAKDTNNKVTIPDAGTTTRLAGATEEANPVTTFGFEALTSVTDVNIDTADAVGYYNKVMGTSIATPLSDYAAGTEVTKGDASATKALAVATLPKTADGYDFSVVEIRFVVYLDGWDNYCYDIMQNQSINFSFNLTTDSSLSVIHTN